MREADDLIITLRPWIKLIEQLPQELKALFHLDDLERLSAYAEASRRK